MSMLPVRRCAAALVTSYCLLAGIAAADDAAPDRELFVLMEPPLPPAQGSLPQAGGPRPISPAPAIYLEQEQSASGGNDVIPAMFELAVQEKSVACDAAADCGCDACDHDCCGCCDCDVRWYVQADALIVTRDNAAVDRPVVLADGTGDTVLTPRDLSFGIAGGPRIFFGRICPSGDGLEFGYFGVWSGAASARAVDPGNLSIPPPLGPTTNDFDGADAMMLTWNWYVQNAECNWSRGSDEFSYLIGFRYFNLSEQFNIQAQDSDGDVSDYHIRTSNNLVGGQFGVRWRREAETWGYGVNGKAGLFGNDSIQRQTVDDNNNTFLLRDARGRESSTSLVADIDVFLTYRLSDQWRVRAGYYLLWVTQVALAPDQLDFSFDAESGSHVHDTGSLFMHGGTAGLEFGW